MRLDWVALCSARRAARGKGWRQKEYFCTAGFIYKDVGPGGGWGQGGVYIRDEDPCKGTGGWQKIGFCGGFL